MGKLRLKMMIDKKMMTKSITGVNRCHSCPNGGSTAYGPQGYPVCYLSNLHPNFKIVKVPNFQDPKFPISQIPMIPNYQDHKFPRSQIPKIPNCHDPKLPESQIPIFPRSQIPQVPNSQIPKIQNSQDPKFLRS